MLVSVMILASDTGRRGFGPTEMQLNYERLFIVQRGRNFMRGMRS
jgi:hypothetical protein